MVHSDSWQRTRPRISQDMAVFQLSVRKNVCVCTRAHVRASARLSLSLSLSLSLCVTMKNESPTGTESMTSDTGDDTSKQQQPQRKEIFNKGKRPVSPIDHCHPNGRKKDKQLTIPTHVAVYLFQDLHVGQDRSSKLQQWVPGRVQRAKCMRVFSHLCSTTFC